MCSIVFLRNSVPWPSFLKNASVHGLTPSGSTFQKRQVIENTTGAQVSKLPPILRTHRKTPRLRFGASSHPLQPWSPPWRCRPRQGLLGSSPAVALPPWTEAPWKSRGAVHRGTARRAEMVRHHRDRGLYISEACLGRQVSQDFKNVSQNILQECLKA